MVKIEESDNMSGVKDILGNPETMVVIQQVSVLFLLIVVGYFVKKLNVVSDKINNEISSLVINVTLPAFLITAMGASFSRDKLMNSWWLLVIAFSIYFLAILCSYLFVKVMKIEGRKKDIYQYVIVFANTGFMGYPVVDALYGKEGIFYTAIYNLAFTVLIWTFGVYLMKRTDDHEVTRNFATIMQKMLSPALFAVIIGFTLFLFSIPIPTTIYKTLEIVGGATTPLSMMFIGFILAEIPLKDIADGKNMVAVTLVRLIILPFLVYVALKAFGFSGFLLNIPVLITAMPAAANTAILSARYNNDFKLASKLIFVTTLLSIMTIPLVIGLIQNLS